MYNIPIDAPINTPVLICTKFGGSYDGRTGTIVAYCDEDFNNIPASTSDVPAAWYRVRFDIPVNCGNKTFYDDVFRRRELFPKDYPRDYWGRPAKPSEKRRSPCKKNPQAERTG